MPSARALLAALSLMPYVAAGQPSPTPAAGPVFAVGYVETLASKAEAGSAALAQYRAALKQQQGLIAVELFAQAGRPGHFAVLETWRDQAAFDGRDAAGKRQLMEALAPIRVSDYDERPYKSLTLAPAKNAAPNTRSAFVVSHVDVAPNTAAPMLLLELADASRQEPGNLRFDVLQHTMRANHFTVIEQWRNQDALDAHVGTPHARAYRDALQPLTGSPLDERVYTAIPDTDGSPKAMRQPRTEN
jgi:quinol monooxygenase YgiN